MQQQIRFTQQVSVAIELNEDVALVKARMLGRGVRTILSDVLDLQRHRIVVQPEFSTFVTRVENRRPARGGVDGEDIENAKVATNVTNFVRIAMALGIPIADLFVKIDGLTDR